MANADQERYLLQHKLGSGGMGEVWLATDTLLNRPVAIKYLKATQDTVQKDFFLSEARTLASLHHPHISLIYDAVFDQKQNRFYLVMEYVEGKPLSTLMAEWAGPLPLQIILDVTIGILAALEYAHGKGIVHRDIKPENVIIQADGVKLADFGLAGLVSLLAQGSDYIVGTPAYMAPEQIAGRAVDGRADLYSLGVMLFELTSGGQQPFPYAAQTDLFEAHLAETPPDLSQLAPDLPVALQRLIMRLLAKEPEARYASAGEVLNILTALQARLKFSQLPLHLLDPDAKPLVNRTAELAQLEAAWSDSQRSATARLVVVQGQAGSGKSRLVAEFLAGRVIDQGCVALVGRCDESRLPYAPFAEILATMINRGLTKTPPTANQLDQLLDRVPGLARLLNLGDRPAGEDQAGSFSPAADLGLWAALSDRVPEPAPRESSRARWQFFATVLTLLAQLGPAAVFLEDATVLDEASVALTRFLIGQGQLPVLFVAACRESRPDAAWLGAFPSNEKTIISLAPLTPAGVREYAASLLGGPVPEAAAREIVERSGGNPLQIEAITRQLLEATELWSDDQGVWHYRPVENLAPAETFLPGLVLSAFTRKLDKLSETSRKLLGLAALIEPEAEFNVNTWLTLLGGESQRELALQALNEALKNRLLRHISDDRYAFRPPDIAGALRAQLSQERRSSLHGQFAEIMRQEQADPRLVAYHYEQAGLAAEAAHYMAEVGAQAAAANALQKAIDYYNQAVTLVPSGPAYEALGELYRRTGQPAEALPAFEHALALAEQAGNITDQARILNSLAFNCWFYDYYKEAYRHAAAVLKLPGLPEIERVAAQSHLGLISWLAGQFDEAEAWYHKAGAAAKDSDQAGSLAEVTYRLGQVYLSRGQLVEAYAAFQDALELYHRREEYPGQGYCLAGLARVAIEQGDFEQAHALLELAQETFDKVYDRAGLLTVFVNRGRALLGQERLDQALAWLRQALHVATDTGRRSAPVLADIYLLMAQVSLASGQPARAMAAAQDALKRVEAAGSREYLALARATLARLYLVQHDLPASAEMFKSALALFKQIGSRTGLLRTRLAYTQLLQQQGHETQAAALAAAVRVAAAEIGLYL